MVGFPDNLIRMQRTFRFPSLPDKNWLSCLCICASSPDCLVVYPDNLIAADLVVSLGWLAAADFPQNNCARLPCSWGRDSPVCVLMEFPECDVQRYLLPAS